MIEPLDGLEISKLLNKDRYTKKIFRSVTARGRLPQSVKKLPSVYVINTDYYFQKGKHWVFIAFFSKYTLFFDSFGINPIYYNFPQIVKRAGAPLILNTLSLQSQSSSACGYYCIYFIYFLSRGKTLNEILGHFSKTNKKWNDMYVFHFVRKLGKVKNE